MVSRERGGAYAEVQIEGELCRFRKEGLPQNALCRPKNGGLPVQIGRRVLPRFRNRKENLAVICIRARRSPRSSSIKEESRSCMLSVVIRPSKRHNRLSEATGCCPKS